jgi:hypothetical protein
MTMSRGGGGRGGGRQPAYYLEMEIFHLLVQYIIRVLTLAETIEGRTIKETAPQDFYLRFFVIKDTPKLLPAQ